MFENKEEKNTAISDRVVFSFVLSLFLTLSPSDRLHIIFLDLAAISNSVSSSITERPSGGGCCIQKISCLLFYSSSSFHY